jgi:hypothetical protein
METVGGHLDPLGVLEGSLQAATVTPKVVDIFVADLPQLHKTRLLPPPLLSVEEFEAGLHVVRLVQPSCGVLLRTSGTLSVVYRMFDFMAFGWPGGH